MKLDAKTFESFIDMYIKNLKNEANATKEIDEENLKYISHTIIHFENFKNVFQKTIKDGECYIESKNFRA